MTMFSAGEHTPHAHLQGGQRQRAEATEEGLCGGEEEQGEGQQDVLPLLLPRGQGQQRAGDALTLGPRVRGRRLRENGRGKTGEVRVVIAV